jgi:ABC-type multidrug transport system ATPase subunit
VEQTLENLREQIAKADVTISRVRPIIEKLKLGINFVQQITVEADPEKALSEFLCGTKREIGELFSAIHSPQEFESVEVDSSGSLCARRKRDGNLCSVSEMSSGQRSALGISLFLVMNRLATRAPRIILMDDPMAHVDDLNALAFFDCLREITANGSRQLFFATASGKAAALFCKKFDFMGKDFVIHKLTS